VRNYARRKLGIGYEKDPVDPQPGQRLVDLDSETAGYKYEDPTWRPPKN
jgi:hypothetical protein